jgi:hypothetical protein
MFSKFNLTLLLVLLILVNSSFAQYQKVLPPRLGVEYHADKSVRISSGSLDSLVIDLIEDVETDSIEHFIQSLQDFGTRYWNAPNRKEVSEWIMNKFLSFGIEEVKLDSFRVDRTWQYNVVAVIPAVEPTDKVFVIGAHHDSITGSTPASIAPGADDNASGTAGVLEITRIIMENNYQPEADIIFATFAAEEIGLYGSRDFAQKAKASGMNIHLMINHDMISYSPYDVQNSRLAINHYSGSENYTGIALYCADTFTPLQVYKETLNSSGSDSYSFYKEGFNSVYFDEYYFSPFYHSDNDIIENINIPFCAEVIKASCATLIYSMFVPAAVKDLKLSDDGSGNLIYAEWQESDVEDFKEYIVHIGESPNDFNRELTTTENNIVIDGLYSGTNYYVGVSVVDEDGHESIPQVESYIPIYFSLDQGILIVDESANGNGTIMRPTDEEIDEYYSELLRNYYISDFDLKSSEELSVTDIGSYSTIIWHGDDALDFTAAGSAVEELKRYLNAGGNFIFSGHQPVKAFESNNEYPASFEEGDFVYDYLKIGSVEKKIATRFYGGISISDDYTDIYVDSTKGKESLNYHLQNIEGIFANGAGSEIYIYDTQFDSTSIQGAMKGMPVGVEYIGEDYKSVVLSFPLYYMNKNEAQMFIDKVIGEKFYEPTGIEDITQAPASFELLQNYPNPFNPSTTIEYSLPVVKTQHAASPHSNNGLLPVKLVVYDILGREVAVLVDGYKHAGNYKVSFNAESLTSGVYFYTLKAGNFVESKKMILLK